MTNKEKRIDVEQFRKRVVDAMMLNPGVFCDVIMLYVPVTKGSIDMLQEHADACNSGRDRNYTKEDVAEALIEVMLSQMSPEHNPIDDATMSVELVFATLEGFRKVRKLATEN